MNQPPITPPDSTGLEVFTAMIRGALSLVPGGGAVTEIINLGSPVERRKVRWMEDISEAVTQIREHFQLLPEQLVEDERFITAVIQATPIALRTHQEEKRRALRQALISTASPTEKIQDDLASRYIRFIDELGVADIRLLHSVSLNQEHLKGAKSLEEIYRFLATCTKEAPDRYLFRTALQDLRTRFLVLFDDLDDLDEFASKTSHMVTEESSQRDFEVTPLGRGFLRFIGSE